MPAGCLRATNACLKKAACHLLVHHWRKLRKVKSTRTGSHLIPCTAEPMKSIARETLRYMAETNAAIRVTSRHWHHQCDDSGSNTPDIESSLCLFKPDVCILSWTNDQGPRTMYIQSQVSIQCTSKGTNHTVEYQLVVHVWNQHCDSEWSDLLTLFSSLRRRTHKHSLRIAKLKGSKSKMAPWDKN